MAFYPRAWMKVLVLKRTFFSFFQLWWLAILEPVGVQRHNVPHFKGLIVLYLDSRSSRAWQHFYLPPRPLEKGHFTPKMAKVAYIFLHDCNCYLSEKFDRTQNVEYLFMLTGNCCFYFFKMTLFWCRINWYMTWTCSFKCTICSIFPHCEYEIWPSWAS